MALRKCPTIWEGSKIFNFGFYICSNIVGKVETTILDAIDLRFNLKSKAYAHYLLGFVPPFFET